MKADLAIFLAFLNTNTSFIIRKTNPKINPTIEITIKTIWGIKLESVMDVVTGRSAYFGMNMKIRISIIGMATPMIEYTSGYEELRQAKHHTTLNAIATIIMKVPIPIPAMRPPGVWQLTIVVRRDSTNRLVDFSEISSI
jgi:hypothetical protein